MLPDKAEEIVGSIVSGHPTEFVVVHYDGAWIRVDDASGGAIWAFSGADAEDAGSLVDMFRLQRMAARLKSTKLVPCPICEWCHPSDFRGDCRDDGNRFPSPDDAGDEADYFDDGAPGLGITEKTYVRSHDHCEVMIGLDEGDGIVRVYAYRDSAPEIPGVTWMAGPNRVFVHADDVATAADYVMRYFNLTDE